MKAVVLTGYGGPDLLHLKEVAKPQVGDSDILVKVAASTVTLGDCELRTLALPAWTRFPMRLYVGYRKPRNFVPGMEMSGVVETVGLKVKAFKPGDAVFGSTGMSMGGNAEYKVISEKSTLALKPPGLNFHEAACLSVGGINALHFIRKAAIKPGQKVLINGAGGSIGTFGVQLARLLGGVVTAVDRGDKLEMLKQIGATYLIDYTQENFWDNGEKYDVIFDMVYRTPFKKCIDSLANEGVYLMANPGPRRMLRSIAYSRNDGKRVIFQFASETRNDLEHLAQLVSSGNIRPVIDRVFPLEKLADAHAYVEQGRKKGCVVISHV